MGIFCNHTWGRVTEDRYQYCEKCGKARRLPCDHVWENINKIKQTLSDGFTKQESYIYLNRCKKCGEMTKYKY